MGVLKIYAQSGPNNLSHEHKSLETTQAYLGKALDNPHAPGDYLGLNIEG